MKVAGGTGGVPPHGATLVQAEPFLELLLQGAPKDLSVCAPTTEFNPSHVFFGQLVALLKIASEFAVCPIGPLMPGR